MSQTTPGEVIPHHVLIPNGGHDLKGLLAIPERARGIVVFAPGCGRGGLRPRYLPLIRTLHAGGLATLEIDLLDETEVGDREKAFNLDLLADRLVLATDWLQQQPETRAFAVGYFGSGIGAAAAVVAAAKQPGLIEAIVMRGGRPDLARDWLASVRTPTLFLISGEDDSTLFINAEAYTLMRGPKRLTVIPGATHLGPEPCPQEEVARLAYDWFDRYLNTWPSLLLVRPAEDGPGGRARS
jgi:putative phosphoribosyl transferase